MNRKVIYGGVAVSVTTGILVALLSKKWTDPIPKGKVGSGYGYRIHPVTGKRSFHNGLDIAASTGTDIHSVGSGIVVAVWHDKINGNAIRIRHKNGFISGYAHLSRHLVRKGQKVRKGDIIGKVGNTGRSTGAHLHITLFDQHGNTFDPTQIIYRS